MAVAGVTTQQGRDIDGVLNASTRPRSLLGMFFGENSSLDESSHRDMGKCDVSGNIPHISICRAVDAGLVPPNDPAAFWRWTADTPTVLATARSWYETNIAWAEQTIGAGDERVDLLAAVWWNAPNAGAVPEAKAYGTADPRTRKASADFWLDPNLATNGADGAKYVGRRQNYIRGLGQADPYVVEEEPLADITLPSKGPDPVFASLDEAAAYCGGEAYRKQLIETAAWAIAVRDEALFKQCYETLNPDLYVPHFDEIRLGK